MSAISTIRHRGKQLLHGIRGLAARAYKNIKARLTLTRTNKILGAFLVVMAIFWSAYGVNHLWNNSYSQLISGNAAQLTQASALLQNLPTPATIKVSQSSGNTPYVIYAYNQAAEELHKTPIVHNNIVLTGRVSTASMRSLHKESSATLSSSADILTELATFLQKSQQFIEYNPMVDLQPYASGAETDASERLSRTKDGIISVQKALQPLTFPGKQSILSKLDSLSGTALKVTPQSVSTWTKSVKDTQDAIIKSASITYTPLLGKDSAQKLQILSQAYISLR